ncbi:hypothetical protein JD276_03045 [Leucobacter sp. CSA1]|uniref:Uncharacterized protein n=1 Tax=Leucobacter chromiisoli TaxID=2796471 RepID=A0A934UU38_9MICO|nr:hypothetical protein [Leucobacter chromiisoli]MBK0418011.1 hypothetical protein [Leucobacter chromiisoli]
MVNASNTSAISTGTGRAWEEWVELLERSGARDLTHTDIARLALELMPESVERREWWAQGTAVAFEQHAGLRVPGQTCDGDFQLSTTRTVRRDKDEALRAWLELVEGRDEFGGVPLDGGASTSGTEKWRYWRAPLSDGTRVSVNITDKTEGKASVGLVHSRLDSASAIEYWRPVWKGLLAQI